ncbi:flavin reductase [Streptomyces pseudoechinosporeus]
MDGRRPHGTTVSAFASLSMTPPMVLVSLGERSQLLTIIRRTGRFGLNILGTQHPGLPHTAGSWTLHRWRPYCHAQPAGGTDEPKASSHERRTPRPRQRSLLRPPHASPPQDDPAAGRRESGPGGGLQQ